MFYARLPIKTPQSPRIFSFNNFHYSENLQELQIVQKQQTKKGKNHPKNQQNLPQQNQFLEQIQENIKIQKKSLEFSFKNNNPILEYPLIALDYYDQNIDIENSENLKLSFEQNKKERFIEIVSLQQITDNNISQFLQDYLQKVDILSNKNQQLQQIEQNNDDYFIDFQKDIFTYSAKSLYNLLPISSNACNTYYSIFYQNQGKNQKNLLRKQATLLKNSEQEQSQKQEELSNFYQKNSQFLVPNNLEQGQIKGIFSYYHYGQQQQNDLSWGCAYRSLQTVASYLFWNGFTQKGVPSIQDIQEILVKIGDKDKGFVGSQEWIGAFEVSYVLEYLYGVESRMCYVPSGGQIMDFVPQLQDHLEKHGTPIMFGGGQYAYTLLAIKDNKFLILDPHYVGADDRDRIKEKKGIYWTNAKDQFKDREFYNFCMPIVNKN